MKKRKLNRQQPNQIAANLAVKKDDTSSTLRDGIVIGHFGKAVEVLATPAIDRHEGNFPLPIH